MLKILKKIFCVNSNERHKIYTFFGIKFKFRNITHCKEICTSKIKAERDFYQAICEAFKNADKELQHYIIDNSLYDSVSKLIPHAVSDIRIEVNLVDHCNLNCKFCDHFSPIAKEKFLDVDLFERDMARLSQLTNGILGGISLVGGEPLLHKNVCSFFEISRKYFPDTLIDMVTNGILLKNNDEVWGALKKYNIKLMVTTYPIKLDYEYIDKKARQMELLYERFFMFGTKSKEKVSVHHPFRLQGDVKKEDFIQCYHFNRCITLKEGKLYTCPIIPNSIHFSKYFNKNLQIKETDYIDIYQAKNYEEISKFLVKRPHFCSYCDVTKRSSHPYGISRKLMEEWT